MSDAPIDKAEILRTLSEFLRARLLDAPNIRPDLDLYGAGYIDSLRAVDFSMFVESTYGVVVTEEEIDRKYKTLNTVVERVHVMMAARRSDGLL